MIKQKFLGHFSSHYFLQCTTFLLNQGIKLGPHQTDVNCWMLFLYHKNIGVQIDNFESTFKKSFIQFGPLVVVVV